MFRVEIRRPRLENIKDLNKFFRTVITDTFIKEGIGDKLNDISEEIAVKRKYLESDFQSNGENRCFLVAFYDGRIIGSIECGQVSDLIRKCTNNKYKGLIEVGTVFVLPEFQRKGVGNLLLSAVYCTLQQRGIKEFCLDSGYRNAQSIWKKKFGDPEYLLKDYWDIGVDHMIWRVKVDDKVI